jgi:hypothetical protein
LKSNNKRYNIDDVAIDDEAGFTFNNRTIERGRHKMGPGTDGDVHDDGDDEGGDALAGELAELRRGLKSTSRWRDSEAATFVLVNFRNNENFCLGSGNVDGGDDGYSPLGVFGLDGDDDGNSGGWNDDTGETGDQTNRKAGRLGRWLTDAERR